MKRNIVLTITSLCSILLLSIHLTQDALQRRPGTWDSGPGNLVAILILLVFLCGTVLLAGRRSGTVITLLGSLFAAGMPVIHLMRPRLGPVVDYSAAFFFMWTLYALGVTGMFSAILAVRELWSFRRAK
jgi:hypothetical protein